MLIYLLGTDGSGKTTLSRRLRDAEGDDLGYVYCQHKPVLVWLLKAPARLLYMRRTDQFGSYSDYKAAKDSVVAKRRLAARLYALLTYADVIMQSWPKIMWARMTRGTVVVDRYYLDWIVNASTLLSSSTTAMLSDARWIEKLLPRADLHVFLDVSEAVAFSRKDDIQSIEYLSERKSRYLLLAQHYDFAVVDANRPIDDVYRDLSELVRAARKEPQA